MASLALTLAQKILQAHAEEGTVTPGEIVMVRCDVVMTNDISGPVAFKAMERMGATRVFDPAKVVVVADHFVPAKDERSASLQKLLKEWADAQGVTYYGQGRGGIEHTVLVEEGWVVPGSVIAGGDSHTCTYGALGAFGTGLGSTDIAACLATGVFWQAVPGTIRVEFTGERQPFVTGKDLILAVIAEIGVAGGMNTVLEFVGDGAASLSVDERLAVANMAVEAGAETGLFPADDTIADVSRRQDRAALDRRSSSDPDAELVGSVQIDLSSLPPLVALPSSPGNVVPLDEAVGLADRPGLHRQLLERDDHRPAPGGGAAAWPLGAPEHPRDHRAGVPEGLPTGARGGPDRRLRRGGGHGLDSHVRRLLRRQHGDSCPR